MQWVSLIFAASKQNVYTAWIKQADLSMSISYINTIVV